MLDSRRLLLLSRAGIILMVLGIYTAMLAPDVLFPNTTGVVGPPGSTGDTITHKGFHVAAFAALAIAVFVEGVIVSGKRAPNFDRCIVGTLLVLVAAWSTEQMQGAFIPGRHGRIEDVRLDFAGAVLGWMIAFAISWAVSSRIRKRRLNEIKQRRSSTHPVLEAERSAR